jgi:cyclase
MGADKVSINTAAVRNPALVTECARLLGSQAVVVAIDAARRSNASWEVFVQGGRIATGLDAVAWAREVVAKGCGEILLTSIDRDGTRDGYDLDLIDAVASSVRVPVIASGGAGKASHVADAFHCGAEAALAASIFHYGHLRVRDLKHFLDSRGIPVRKDEHP